VKVFYRHLAGPGNGELTPDPRGFATGPAPPDPAAGPGVGEDHSSESPPVARRRPQLSAYLSTGSGARCHMARHMALGLDHRVARRRPLSPSVDRDVSHVPLPPLPPSPVSHVRAPAPPEGDHGPAARPSQGAPQQRRPWCADDFFRYSSSHLYGRRQHFQTNPDVILDEQNSSKSTFCCANIQRVSMVHWFPSGLTNPHRLHSPDIPLVKRCGCCLPPLSRRTSLCYPSAPATAEPLGPSPREGRQASPSRRGP